MIMLMLMILMSLVGTKLNKTLEEQKPRMGMLRMHTEVRARNTLLIFNVKILCIL